MNKKVTSARLSETTKKQIDGLKKAYSLDATAVIETAISRMSESPTDKKLRKLYKAAKKTTLSLYAKRDFEGLNGLESNILSVLNDLTEYIEQIFKDDSDDNSK